MKVKTGLVSALAFGWLCLGLVATSQAGLTLKYDPVGLTQSNSAGVTPFIAQIDVLVGWDGAGSNTFSGIDFDVITPAGVELQNNPTPSNPLGFQFASVNFGVASFSSLSGDVAPFVAGVDKPLTTLSFSVTPVEGTFPLGLNVTFAQQGAGAAVQDITPQFSSAPGSLVVAVPEPSSFALMGAVSLAGFGWRRRRS